MAAVAVSSADGLEKYVRCSRARVLGEGSQEGALAAASVRAVEGDGG